MTSHPKWYLVNSQGNCILTDTWNTELNETSQLQITQHNISVYIGCQISPTQNFVLLTSLVTGTALSYLLILIMQRPNHHQVNTGREFIIAQFIMSSDWTRPNPKYFIYLGPHETAENTMNPCIKDTSSMDHHTLDVMIIITCQLDTPWNLNWGITSTWLVCEAFSW